MKLTLIFPISHVVHCEKRTSNSIFLKPLNGERDFIILLMLFVQETNNDQVGSFIFSGTRTYV